MGVFKLPRITTTERLTITPAVGELIYDTDLGVVFKGDGTTIGGVELTGGGGGGIGGTIAAGQVAFGTGTNVIGGDSGFSWDNVNKRFEVNGQISTPIHSKGNSGAGTVIFDWNDSNIQEITLNSNCVFNFLNPQSGASYQIHVTQNSQGNYFITFPSIKWEGGVTPTLTGDPNSTDVITLVYNGSTYLGIMTKNFAIP